MRWKSQGVLEFLLFGAKAKDLCDSRSRASTEKGRSRFKSWLVAQLVEPPLSFSPGRPLGGFFYFIGAKSDHIKVFARVPWQFSCALLLVLVFAELNGEVFAE